MTMPPRPRLIVVEGGAEIPLPPRDVIYIGREDAVSNSFPDIDTTPFGGMDKGVSRRHAAIHHEANGGYILEDLGSVNGSYINRDRLNANEKRNLLPGDTVNLGRLAFRFEV
jgi:pSer/pThr/pTyr-binding forkhead associated (FHA) protein